MNKIFFAFFLIFAFNLNCFIVKNSCDKTVVIFYLNKNSLPPRKFNFYQNFRQVANYYYIEPKSEHEMKLDQEAESIWFVDEDEGVRRKSLDSFAGVDYVAGLSLKTINNERTDWYNLLMKENCKVELVYNQKNEYNQSFMRLEVKFSENKAK